MSGLENLTFLSLSGTEISGSLPTSMGKLSKLQVLFLSEMGKLATPIPSGKDNPIVI